MFSLLIQHSPVYRWYVDFGQSHANSRVLEIFPEFKGTMDVKVWFAELVMRSHYRSVVDVKIYNSVADLNSSRVGVGWRMSPFHFHDGITFQRFELEG